MRLGGWVAGAVVVLVGCSNDTKSATTGNFLSDVSAKMAALGSAPMNFKEGLERFKRENGYDVEPRISSATATVSPSPSASGPPPPFAELANQAPGLELAINSDPALIGLWTPARLSDRRLLLTAISQLITQGFMLRNPVGKDVETHGIESLVKNLYLYAVRVGHLPEAFAAAVRVHLAEVSGESHRGVWSKQVPAFDYSALAAWMDDRDASLLREVAAARAEGPYAGWREPTEGSLVDWNGRKVPWLPHLVDERALLERLRTLGPLTPKEQARADALAKN